MPKYFMLLIFLKKPSVTRYTAVAGSLRSRNSFGW